MADQNSDQKRRGKSISFALITSMISKMGTAILQFVSMPIAARVMGKEEFGLYGTISMTITLVILLELGVGPALTQGLSEAHARGDRDAERRYYTTSFLLIAFLGLLGAIVLAVVIATVPIPTLFGAEYAGLESSMRPGLWVGLAVFTIALVLGHTNRAREGYLEAGITNSWMAGANILAACCVGVGVFFFSEVWFLLLAVYGANVLALIGNTVALLRKRPYLLSLRGGIDTAIGKRVLTDGLAFSVGYALTTIVEYNFCALLLGRIHGPGEVAEFQVLVALTIALNGFIVMVATPLWPAVIDARMKGDVEWIKAATRKIRLYVLGLAACACTGLILLGNWGIQFWFGKDFVVGQTAIVAYAAYFLFNAWRRGNHAILLGLGKVRTAAIYTLVEVIITAIIAGFAIKYFGLAGAWGGIAVALACVSAWVFPLLASKIPAPDSALAEAKGNQSGNEVAAS